MSMAMSVLVKEF